MGKGSEELREGKEKLRAIREENAVCRAAVQQRLLNGRGHVHVCCLYTVLMFVTNSVYICT